MKKTIFGILFLCIFGNAFSQNIQILNGMNSQKDYVNFVTFELYRPMNHCTIYYFTDFKIDNAGYFEAYTELATYLNVTKSFSLSAQYNAGLNKDFQIQPVYLAGVSNAFTIGTFNLSVDVLYRFQKELILENEWKHGYQITAVFLQDFDKIQISGFCDFWNSGYFIFEPQGWYKFSKRVYAGLEWRASNYSLLGTHENYVMLGFKFNLE